MKSLNEASMRPIARNGTMNGHEGSKLSVIRQRKSPKKANFTRTPLKKIEKLVEAST